MSFYALNETAQAHLSLFMSNCHIVGNLMLRLIYIFLNFAFKKRKETDLPYWYICDEGDALMAVRSV